MIELNCVIEIKLVSTKPWLLVVTTLIGVVNATVEIATLLNSELYKSITLSLIRLAL